MGCSTASLPTSACPKGGDPARPSWPGGPRSASTRRARRRSMGRSSHRGEVPTATAVRGTPGGSGCRQPRDTLEGCCARAPSSVGTARTRLVPGSRRSGRVRKMLSAGLAGRRAPSSAGVAELRAVKRQRGGAPAPAQGRLPEARGAVAPDACPTVPQRKAEPDVGVLTHTS